MCMNKSALQDIELIRSYRSAPTPQIWEKIINKYEKLIFKTMHKCGIDLATEDFTKHELYTDLVIGIKQAIERYILPEEIESNFIKTGKRFRSTFFTFLYTTLTGIFVVRYKSNEHFHASIRGEGEPDDFEATQESTQPKYQELDNADQIDSHYASDFKEGCVMKLYYGIDCRKPFKASEIQTMIPEYIRFRKETDFKLPVR